MKDFFKYLTSNHLDITAIGARIDFLACSALRPPEIGKLVPLFESVTQVKYLTAVVGYIHESPLYTCKVGGPMSV